MLAGAREEDVVRDRPAQRADAAASKVGQRAEARDVGSPDAQDLPERVVRDRRRHGGAPRRRVLDAAQPDVGVTPGDRLVDGRVADEDEPRHPPETPRDERRNLDVEPHQRVRLLGICLHERSAAFGIPGPSQNRRRIR